MDVKKIALLVGALIVAGIAAVLAKGLFDKSAAPTAVAAVQTGPQVLVATKPLPVGTIVSTDSFRYQPWPKELIENAYYMQGAVDPVSLNGTVVRTAITAGQPVTQGALVKPGDRGFLAAALGPGMRAITVSVSATSGVAGFVFPGDRVDLLLTQSVSPEGSGQSLRTTETFIRNVRVLATDQRTVPEEVDGKRTAQVASSVTLEVTPRIAEKISVAQSLGQLSLTLRSIADNTADLDSAIAAGEVSVPAGTDPKAKNALVQIASRPIDAGSTYVTGADVSRFARMSVPSAKPAAAAPPPPADLGISAMMRALTGAARPTPAAGSEQTIGPVVRVTRGQTVTIVPVGGK